MGRVLTVCRANVCRSAGAAALLAARLPASVDVRSAGVAANAGTVMCDAMSRWLSDAHTLDANAAPHRSRMITDEMIDENDLILVASLRQRGLILTRSPKSISKTFTMREAALFANNLPDPNARPSESAADALARLGRDWHAMRGTTRFPESGEQTITIRRDDPKPRWWSRSTARSEIAVSAFDVPDAHTLTHGDHEPTFAALEPAIRSIAAAVVVYLGADDPGQSAPAPSERSVADLDVGPDDASSTEDSAG